MDSQTCRDSAGIIRKLSAIRRQQLALMDKMVGARFQEMVTARFSEAVPLRSLCNIIPGLPQVSSSRFSNDGIPLLRGRNIQPNRLDETRIAHIPAYFTQLYSEKILRANDILVRQTGSPGEACVVPSVYAGGLVHAALILRVREGQGVDSEYLCRYINSGFGRRYVACKTRNYMSAETLANMPVVVLSEEEQMLLRETAELAVRCSELVRESLQGLIVLRSRLECENDIYKEGVL